MARRLSEDDRALWARVAAGAEPLHPRAMGSAPPPATATAIPSAAPEPPPIPRPQGRVGSKAAARPPANDFAAPVERMVDAAPLRMDAKRHKRMTAGKLRPEAKLDLHGMTLDRAHPELVRFVTDAHARGLRLVLVVTGKGKRRPAEGIMPRRTGVLRHQVPQWLALPPLAALVLQVRTAHRTQGGEGAYTVYLRR